MIQGEISGNADPLHGIESDIIKSLLYSDLFNYPLTAEELFNRRSIGNISFMDMQKTLKSLLAKKLIFQFEDHYSVHNAPELSEKRTKGNQMAADKMPKARKISNFINAFPFVRAVFLSGSISKNYMEEDSDIDYFIITSPKRLWICRTILILYKKVFLLNSRKHFCLNYFIDEDHLLIEEQNLFTATELITTIPVCGKNLYEKFFEVNKWVKNYYFNPPKSKFENLLLPSKRRLKSLLEAMLSGKFGSWMDKKCMNFTISYWKKKFPKFSPSEFNIALKSKKTVSKHHPQNFQKKVRIGLSEKITAFEELHGVKISNNF